MTQRPIKLKSEDRETPKEEAERIREEVFNEEELCIDMEERKQRHLRKNGYIPPTTEELREDHIKGDDFKNNNEPL